MESAKWYQEEVVKLRAIMHQMEKENEDEPLVARDYIIEKLDRILNEVGIGIHFGLKHIVKRKLEDLRK